MIHTVVKPGEFRLIRLLSRLHSNPSDQLHLDDPICCELFRASLADRPEYTALSYTWGDAADTVPIIVNNTKFLVTRNLHIALEHIREDHDNVTLWVDALCIDQTNAPEKSEQVQQMSEIYENAVQTTVWLGPEEDGSNEVMLYLSKAGEFVSHHGIYDDMIEMTNLPTDEEEKRSRLDATVKERLAPLFAKAMADLPLTILFLTATIKLLSRRYWNRIWILQEFVLASNLQIRCGNSTISFKNLHGCAMFLIMARVHIVRELGRQLAPVNFPLSPEMQLKSNQFTYLSKINFSNSATLTVFGMRLGHHWFRENPSEGSLTLAQLLAKAHVNGKSNSSEDKDRIYALLGLASNTHQLGIIPDYSQSTSCADIFTSTARAIISSGLVDFLSFSQTRHKKLDMPTWVPDWRTEVLRPCGRFPWFTSFCASEDMPFEMPTGHDDTSAGEIKLRGCQVDVIEALKAPWTPGPEGVVGVWTDGPAQYLDDILQLCEISNGKFIQSGTEIYFKASDRDEAHIRIPIADQYQHEMDGIRRADHTCHPGHAAALEAIRRLRNAEPGEGIAFKGSGYIAMMGWQRNRRPFVSREGYVGLAPDHAQAGDVIVVFLGAKFPYILRKSTDGKYSFIGEAYVHGIMYGELMKTNPRVDDFILT